MFTRRGLLALTASSLRAQKPPDSVYLCPMDADVRTAAPGRCPRCGMKLVAGLPPHEEYPVEITPDPRRLEPGKPVRLRFRILDPYTRQLVRELEEIHERRLHLFVLHSDLGFFAHEHPEAQADGSYLYEMAFPRPGHYRLACDFYPRLGTPQMVARSLIVPGAPVSSARAALPEPEKIHLETDPPAPSPGTRTMLLFHLDPSIQLRPYLGALGHLLAASPDLADLVHTHPFLRWPDGRLQFNIIFPRPGLHRVWVQVQDEAILRTVAFDVPVRQLG